MPPPDQNELDANVEEDIRNYKIMKWITLRSAAGEGFRDVMAREGSKSIFDDDYILSVAERWRELQRTHLRFSIMLFLLILFMGAVNSEEIQQISLFGMRITGDGPALAVLLLLTSILMFFVTVVSLISDSYGDVVKTYVEMNQSDEVSNLYLFQFGWTAASLFSGAKVHSYRWSAKIALIVCGVFIAGSVIGAACKTLIDSERRKNTQASNDVRA